ncbi:signal peptide peptidase SppA [Thermoflavifilum thermophilum]|uniref:Protease-4 n=1 Tax=Thermoflavifilum thermophilum TaxID=1393122 RepID=A0A1I7N1A8_9BACT|nr:signal peptide peptidase SppA [Thermoflavifilum thermophilum]SFV28449.1 protease-4 [Thermoflavifilum thermophilum]
MKRFLSSFLASLLALIVFFLICFFLLLGIVGGLTMTTKKVSVESGSWLVMDLSKPLLEQELQNPLLVIAGKGQTTIMGLHDVVRAIHQAAHDQRIAGIYLKLGETPNGFATAEEIRNALEDFKHQSHKPIYAYGDIASQRAYYMASVADSIFLNPQGVFEFRGFAVRLAFLKGLLDKLEIKPQIFYQGKYKSATEPFRLTRMSEANRIQTTAFLQDFYRHFLNGIALARNLDTAALARYAAQGVIQQPVDAVKLHLIDGVKYDDQMQETLKRAVQLGEDERLHTITISNYWKAIADSVHGQGAGQPAIALIYAQGEIIDGSAENQPGDQVIAADDYIKWIREVRRDDRVKAIVFRVNSPGGSALAADKIWRELYLARKQKPVVVSMGDYAASGGYYISCMADSIFIQPNTLTGSIGVFTIIPNLQDFFQHKLGVSFDGVKTAPLADMGTIDQPLTDVEKKWIQNQIDTVYATFCQRVAQGRHMPVALVDSLAQGRVWSGLAAVQNGLADRIGGLDDALQCAASMSHLKTYRLEEYPPVKNPIQKIIESFNEELTTSRLKATLGNYYPLLQQWSELKSAMGTPQARLPFWIFLP